MTALAAIRSTRKRTNAHFVRAGSPLTRSLREKPFELSGENLFTYASAAAGNEAVTGRGAFEDETARRAATAGHAGSIVSE